MKITPTKIWVIEGGMLPCRGEEYRQKDNDVGIDLTVRAIVAIESSKQQLQREGAGRKSLFDFINPPTKEINKAKIGREKTGEYFYRLQVGETIPLGLGVVVEIAPGWAGYVEPRGSTIRNHDRDSVLSSLNSTVPIDPGFRGEIWAELKNEGPGEFKIIRHAILFQLVRKKVDVSSIVVVENYDNLSKTHRGCQSNGSTTCHLKKNNNN